MRHEAVARPRSRFSLTTFQALKYRDYRLLFFGQVGSGLAQQAEMLIRSWLILDLTGSAVMLGLVHVTRAVGSFLVTPVSGVVADRIDRRYLLIAANLVNALFFLLLAVLVITEQIEVWHVVVSAIVAGAAMTMQNAAKQAIIPSMVPREGIMNAVALNAVTMGADRILGPSMAGFMIQFTGVQGAYLALGALMIIPAILYGFVRPVKVVQPVQESFTRSFLEGVSFSLRTPVVRIIILVNLTAILLSLPYLQMMPLYVREVLDMGPGALGLIVAIPGFLTIGGGLVAASLGDFKYKGRLMFVGAIASPFTCIVLALTASFWAAVLAACIHGVGTSQWQPASQSAMMKQTPDHLRGRVTSFMSMTSTTGQAGIVLWGVAADQFGIPAAYLTFGVLALVLQVVYYVTMKSYRQFS